jgi:AraC family transcriptional regulator of adaptative response/methylated-DNA-[protein]-cysteine methyltransferase
MDRFTGMDDDERYRLTAARDPAAEGRFWVAVRTTGVVCRPTCPSRLPLRQNVEFHDTPWGALVAGFRACRRCRPLGPETDRRLWITRIETPLGTMVAAAVDEGLAVLDFADRRAAGTALRDASRRLRAFPTPVPPTATADHVHLAALHRQLADYFAGTHGTFDLPLAIPDGTGFETSVWRWLRTIPPGETRTYAEGAEAVGRPTAVRAVGRANGRNPVAIIVPCHRVIGSDGDLTGYGGGLWRKRALIHHEAELGTLPDKAPSRQSA